MKQSAGSRQRDGWLLFFSRIPAKPVGNRVKVWRKLAKCGARPLKGAVYVLPDSDEHREAFQWLVSEVEGMGGEAAYTRVDSVDSMKNAEIVDIFTRNKESEYQGIAKGLRNIEIKIQSIRKGSGSQVPKTFAAQFAQLGREFEEIRRTDFFSSPGGDNIAAQIESIQDMIRDISGTERKSVPQAVAQKSRKDYVGKTWVTRKRPFVDRMASAWLIRRFIDTDAVFHFIDEKEVRFTGPETIAFDISGGEFAHAGDLCTFEVLVRVFGIKDRAVRKVAEIVHDLDIRDDRYRHPEAKGIEAVLTGLRGTIVNDAQLLEQGMSVFEMLYRSMSG